VKQSFAVTTLPTVLSLALIAGALAGCGGPVDSIPVSASVPTPTPTASPPPPGVLSVNPSNMTLIGSGATYTQQIAVVETAYTQAFAVTSTCGNVATLTPLTGTGPSLSVAVTGLAAGSCSATVSDTQNHSVQIAIAVSTAGISLQSLGAGR
jgi:hypothetical protein